MRDVLVVGGGPAGLSAALYLARYDRSVVLLDSGDGRSTHGQVNHNYLGFPDGVAAVDLRKAGREQLARYPHVTLVDEPVGLVERGEDGFVARTAGEEHRARAVVLATGVLDHYPQFDDWESCVGRSMFWCITCDGYENRGRDVVVVGHTDAAACEALQLRSLTDRVRLITNHEHDRISPTFRERLSTAGVHVLHDQIASAEVADGAVRTLLTQGGEQLELEAVFSVLGSSPRSELAVSLGAAVDEDGYVVVDVEQRTTEPLVYAAGDVTALHSHQVSTAVHEGAQAASAVNYDLLPAALKMD